jgi:serine/threonine protein kinase
LLDCDTRSSVHTNVKRTTAFGMPFDVVFTAPEVLDKCADDKPYPLRPYAPERGASTASDVWSLGCVLFHLSSSRLPFAEASKVADDASVAPLVSLVRSRDPRSALPLPLGKPLHLHGPIYDCTSRHASKRPSVSTLAVPALSTRTSAALSASRHWLRALGHAAAPSAPSSPRPMPLQPNALAAVAHDARLLSRPAEILTDTVSSSSTSSRRHRSLRHRRVSTMTADTAAAATAVAASTAPPPKAQSLRRRHTRSNRRSGDTTHDSDAPSSSDAPAGDVVVRTESSRRSHRRDASARTSVRWLVALCRIVFRA